MYPKNTLPKDYSSFFYLLAILLLLLLLVISAESKAQARQVLGSSKAVCLVKVAGTTKENTGKENTGKTAEIRSYRLEPNQLGNFNRVANIAPLEKVPVEMYYPDGKPGEEIVILVQDGGMLDNGNRLKVGKLDNERKLSFGFQVTDHPGLHRVMLRRGLDSKVVPLWVGPEPAPVKK
jgi:hypothetical protein